MRLIAFSAALLLACQLWAAEFVPGLLRPADLPQQAARQARIAEPVIRELRASAAARRPIGPTPDLARLDWSLKYEVPVIAQGSCGSCWACATAQTLSFQIVIQTGVRANVSAQDVLNCAGKGSCRGGWVAYAAAKTTGYADAEDVPYVGRQQSCRQVERPYRILTWTYLDRNGGTPDDATLKKYLCEVGPIWVGVRSDRALQNYRAGQVWSSPGGTTNHAVTLVGWDDAKSAWIVRNSWGASFGDNGNFLCKYGSNIGDGAAVAWAMPSLLPPEQTEQLQALADDCDDCQLDTKIDGPETASPGTLVKLAAPDLAGARYAWSHTPDALIDSNTYLDSTRRILVVATPCVPGRYWFQVAVSLPDQDPLLLVHGLTVGAPGPAPTPPPGPEPPPGPGPTPAPVVLDSFGEKVKGWAAEVPAASRKAAGEQIAAGFAGVVAGLRDGSLETLGEAQAKVRGAYSLKGQTRTDWGPFFDQLTAAYLERKSDLGDADLLAAAAEQIAAGIRAALGGACPGGVCPAPAPATRKRPAAPERERRGVFRWGLN